MNDFENDSEDNLVNDCGESLSICEDDVKRDIRVYNQLLEERNKFKKAIISRSDPRSILYGL